MPDRDSKTILYIGPLHRGSTTLQRQWSLESLGFRILPFDMMPYYTLGGRIERSIGHRFNLGRGVIRLNQDLDRFASGLDYDWVWVDKGVWIYPETLRKLKKNERTLLIHYTPDAQICFNRSRYFLRSIPIYDVLITTKSYECDLYKQHGARHLIFTHQGYDETIFRPYPAEELTYPSDVCFVGRCERHYARSIRAVSAVTRNIAVWGRWGRYAMFHPWFRPFYRSEGIWEAEYAKALGSAKIALGLLSRLAPDRSTTRTFEIPACGAFLLAERTEEHLTLFEEGKEAEFFGSEEELKEKVRYYLTHDEQRKRIAQAGRQRCLKSGYSNTERLRKVLEQIRILDSE